MTLFLNYDMNAICKKILQQQFDKLGLKYTIAGVGEVEITEPFPEEKLKELDHSLRSWNIEIAENKKSIMIQKIKDAIVEMVFMEDRLPLKISSYLSNKLNHNYSYLSNLFSSVTYTSIETFIQLQKTERAKQLISAGELKITEIAWKLNYSSTAHFSIQFKNVTGLTPTAFQRIILKRRTGKDEQQLQPKNKSTFTKK